MSWTSLHGDQPGSDALPPHTTRGCPEKGVLGEGGLRSLDFSDLSARFWAPGPAKSDPARNLVRDTPIFVEIRARRCTFVTDFCCLFSHSGIKIPFSKTTSFGPPKHVFICIQLECKNGLENKTTIEQKGARCNLTSARAGICTFHPAAQRRLDTGRDLGLELVRADVPHIADLQRPCLPPSARRRLGLRRVLTRSDGPPRARARAQRACTAM